MAFSKYYQGFQPMEAKRQDHNALLEALRQMQQQSAQESQPSSSDFNNIGKLAKMGKGFFSSPSVPQGGGQSFGGGDAAYGGIDMPTSTAQSLEMPAGESWYSNLFDFGGGQSAAMSPMAAPVAAVLGANVAHNKGISNWGDTAKGQLAGNTVDYYQGRKDGKQHGAMSKILDPDGATGQLSKAFTDFSTLDFSNGLKGVEDGLKNLFKFKLF